MLLPQGTSAMTRTALVAVFASTKPMATLASASSDTADTTARIRSALTIWSARTAASAGES